MLRSSAFFVGIELQKEAPVPRASLQSCRLGTGVPSWVAAIDSIACELALELHVVLDWLWVSQEMVSRRLVRLDELAECIEFGLGEFQLPHAFGHRRRQGERLFEHEGCLGEDRLRGKVGRSHHSLEVGPTVVEDGPAFAICGVETPG
jgi:hypothetical protein